MASNPLVVADFSGRPRVEPSVDTRFTVVEGGRIVLINPFTPTLLGQFGYGPVDAIVDSASLSEFRSSFDPEGYGGAAVDAGVFAMKPGVGASPAGPPSLRGLRVGTAAHVASASASNMKNGVTNVLTMTSIGLGAWANSIKWKTEDSTAVAADGRTLTIGFRDDPTDIISGRRLGPAFDLKYTADAGPATVRVTVALTGAAATSMSTTVSTGDPGHLAAGTSLLDIDLTDPQFDTVGKLIGYINRQPGYFAGAVETDCDLGTLSSEELDAAEDVPIMAGFRLTAKIGALVHWISQNAAIVGDVPGITAARAVGQTSAPDESEAYTFFASGADAAGVDVTDYQAALDLMDINEIPSGCLFLDTSLATVREICLTWIDDQRAKGRLWRAVFAAGDGDDDAAVKAAASAISRQYVMYVCQSALDIRDASITRGPLIVAATLAGATGGINAPGNVQSLVLTNRRLRFGSIVAASRRTLSQRDGLTKAGVTVLKEAAGSVLVSLAVSTDQGPLRTWRIWSEATVIDWIDVSVRDLLEASKAAWATISYISKVKGDVMRLLSTWANSDAPVLTTGLDPDTGESVPAYSIPIVSVVNGVTSVSFTLAMAGESDHIRIDGLIRKVEISTSVAA